MVDALRTDGNSRAIGYVRQSRRADLDCAVCGEPDGPRHDSGHEFRSVALSPEQQRDTIRKLAARDGIAPESVTIFEDLGRSGGKGKERMRPGYQQALAAIEGGAVDVLYALSLTRIARSTPELYRVAQLAQDRGVRLVFAKEGILDPTAPLGKAQFGMMAVFAEFERDLAVERARDNVAARRSRGERMGRVPYGSRPGDDPEAVIAAYSEAGSLNGAALLLNGRKVRSHLGRQWQGTTVRKVLERHAPGLIPHGIARGVKQSSPFLFYRLIRCHCGTTMTASRDMARGGRVVYRCHAADTNPSHARPYRITEATIRPWIEAEVARLSPPENVETTGQDGKRDALLAKRDRVVDLYADGVIDKAQRAQRLAAIDDELGKLDTVRQVLAVPTIDWSWPAETLNPVLRALFRSVDLGPDMQPVRADWTVPDWRAA